MVTDVAVLLRGEVPMLLFVVIIVVAMVTDVMYCRGKKSQSVDASSSSVKSGVAKMGVALVPPAVPSANVPLEVKVRQGVTRIKP